MIQSNIGKQLDKSFCMVPTFYTKGCPSPSVTGQDRNGDAACCAPGSACASGGGAGCVTRPLGLVGTADLSKTLAKFGAPPAEVSLELFPGQGQPPAAQPLIATNGGGLTLRIVTGAQAVSPSSCVPTRSPPPNVAQADLDFDQEATNAGISSYMVGVGLSQLFFNQVAFEAYNAGLLCLDLDSYNEPLLTSSALGVLLPSLSNIAPGSVPVYAMLHPQNAPTIAVGAGTISPDGGQIIDPLLTVGMQDLRIDLYATVDERPVRLAAVHADVSLELALGVGPDGSSLDILLGDPNKLLVNVTALDDKILAESPAQIAKLIAMVLTLAGPKLAGLPSFNLPAFAGLGLTIEAVHGIAPDGDGGYLDVGLFAALDAGTSVPGAAIFEGETPGSSPIQVSLAGDLEPALAEVLPGGTLSRYPTAVLAIDPSAGPTETSYSIDQGLWSVYIRGERIDATSPRLLIQGHHSIDVRTRHVGSLAVGSAHSFDFLSDYTPPEITLARGARGRWLLSATDNFTPADQLEWASAVGTDTFGGFSAALPDPDALEAQGAFRLRARDLVGNVAEVSSANSAVVGGKAEGGGRGVRTSVSAPRTNGWGCSSAGTGASGLLALAFAALGLGRCRRKRS